MTANASETPACPLCRGRRSRRLFAKGHNEYHRCDSCRFTFAVSGTNPNLENLIEDFEDCYLQYLDADPSDEVNFRRLLKWCGEATGAEGRSWLDIGCGSGKFVRYLRAQGWDAQGLEPSRALYERFLSSEDYFQLGTLDILEEDFGNPFDVVSALDVLEHVEAPRSFLQSAVSLLKPGGKLVLSLPDAGSLPARMLGRRWHFYNDYHLSYFNRRGLETLGGQLELQPRLFRRRGRYRSVGYALRYGWEFVLRRPAPGWVARFDHLAVPLNLLDTMYLVFVKSPATVPLASQRASSEPAPQAV